MDPTLIVTHFKPGSEKEIARLFSKSDATELPELIGVQSRRLYTFHDVYIHLVQGVERKVDADVTRLHDHPLFQEISKALDDYIIPFTGRWGSVEQASAKQFYHWERGLGVIQQP
nr:cyclase [uncultured bacterium]